MPVHHTKWSKDYTNIQNGKCKHTIPPSSRLDYCAKISTEINHSILRDMYSKIPQTTVGLWLMELSQLTKVESRTLASQGLF